MSLAYATLDTELGSVDRTEVQTYKMSGTYGTLVFIDALVARV
ncbi:hypothetical protein SAMN06265367_106232 [Algoriphagus winogradskyi]|uniref:Uncharacterized protein n=1 Tax=Algoriphagus winogradskyi TaxID=237017 RepID=A0ABY1PCH6_9BACT|nr:hypothetical protein SAMN06265367_106232 [Algoriphagus winogradskyi]